MKKFFKTLPNVTIILLVFSFISFIWGSDQKRLSGNFRNLEIVDLSESGNIADAEGKTVFVADTLKLEEYPKDTEMGVTAEGYVLIRTVEMYQYILTNDSVYKEFASYKGRNIEGRNREKYINPEFNCEVSSAVFFGKAVLENKGVVLNESYLNAFHTGDYTKVETVKTYPLDNLNLNGYKNCGEGYYTKANPDKWEIGDIRIKYTYIPESELKEISIFGVVKDGNIVPEDAPFAAVSNATQTVDGMLTANASTDHSSAANGLFVMGIIEIGIAVIAYVVSFIRKKKA